MRKITHKEVMIDSQTHKRWALNELVKSFILYWVMGVIESVILFRVFRAQDWHMNCTNRDNDHDFMIA